MPRGWASDVAILRAGGASVADLGDHLVIRSPHEPGFYWGNFVLVTDPSARDDAVRWIARFDEHFPDAEHVAIGLPGRPDKRPWSDQGLEVETELVLTSERPPNLGPTPSGYEVRALVEAADWAAACAMDLAENGPDGAEPAGAYAEFTRQRAETRRGLVAAEVAAFFGAFRDGELVSQLGIVMCGSLPEESLTDGRLLARYQHVGTAPDHRNRGLAGHLLGVAGAWAADQGAQLWEIHVDPDTPAHRLYTHLGFVAHGTLWQAVRVPHY